jgi:hypothetical protein
VEDDTEFEDRNAKNLRQRVLVHLVGMVVIVLLIVGESFWRLDDGPDLLAGWSLSVKTMGGVRGRVSGLRVRVVGTQTTTLEVGGASAVRDELQRFGGGFSSCVLRRGELD